ncbi:MAG: hypothetical protein Q9201_001539 [Fulgogasparrea decipioides]
MRRLVDAALAALIPASIILHLICAPYTKVEESFNIQATHDVLNHGIWDLCKSSEVQQLQLKEQYDHLTFTGPVPRTFVGPLALAGASWPVTKILKGVVNQQIIVRAVLGLWNALCLLYYRNGVGTAFGRNAANWFILFQTSGFHLMYYASRTLPNFFAFGLVTIALSQLLRGARPSSKHRPSGPQAFLALVTATGVVFRSELVLLLIPHTILFLLTRQLNLRSIIISGLIGGIIGLLLSVPIDSLSWQRFPLWPELSAFNYNILHSQSSKWGTSPWHFYLTSAIPRLLFNPVIYIVCIPLAFAQPALRRPVTDLILPNISFVALYSLQPHKEWRFVIYIIPPLLTAASLGANWIWIRRSKSSAYRILSLALVASVMGSFLASGVMLAISTLNYPGAQALNRLHEVVPLYIAQNPNEIVGTVKVHMDILSCMTGITRFLQHAPTPLPVSPSTLGAGGDTDNVTLSWIYDKTEDEAKLLDPLFWEQFDWVLAERVEKVIGKWEIVDTIGAYSGIRLMGPNDQRKGDLEHQGLADESKMWWKDLTRMAERYGLGLTRGWWLDVKLEPRIRILRRQRDIVPIVGMAGDW